MGNLCYKKQSLTTWEIPVHISPKRTSPMIKNSPLTFKHKCKNCDRLFIYNKKRYENYCCGECYWSKHLQN